MYQKSTSKRVGKALSTTDMAQWEDQLRSPAQL